MNRRSFLSQFVTNSITLMTLSSFKKITDELPAGDRMPVMFIGHGSPMNAIEDNEFSRAWRQQGSTLPAPKAILCISAHWQTKGTKVTAMNSPRTIHDFYGFPPELNKKEYPAPGTPEFAKQTAQLIHSTNVEQDSEWGLDHGTWSVLSRMYPEAKIPVYQLSLDYSLSPEWHYALAAELSELRKRGVLIIGSGNIVHNLGMMKWTNEAFDWAIEFDQLVKDKILKGDYQSLVRYDKLGEPAKLSIPTNEHYLPMLYILALKDKKDELSFFAEKTLMGSVSMRSLKFS